MKRITRLTFTSWQLSKEVASTTDKCTIKTTKLYYARTQLCTYVLEVSKERSFEVSDYAAFSADLKSGPDQRKALYKKIYVGKNVNILAAVESVYFFLI